MAESNSPESVNYNTKNSQKIRWKLWKNSEMHIQFHLYYTFNQGHRWALSILESKLELTVMLTPAKIKRESFHYSFDVSFYLVPGFYIILLLAVPSI